MKTKLFLLSLLAFLFAACNDVKEMAVDNTVAVSPENRVIYEMNVGMMTPEGTFQAAQAKLDELRQLGIDIVWLMPVYPRGATKMSPYASMDFRAVNPNYGTLDDMKAFVARAHELGMEVWLDWVPNHVAIENPWVKDHPDYFTKDKKGKMINPFGWMDVFELNYQNPALAEEMSSTMKFWVDEVDIDGFRCDYVSSPTIPVKYWQDLIADLKSFKPGKNVTMMSETDITDPNNARIDSCGFDYDYAWNFQGLMAWKFGKDGCVADSLRQICDKFIADSKKIRNRRMTYLTNHDQNFNDGGHTIEQFYGDNRYLLTVLEFTFYGMPLLYNGQEIGGNQLLDYFNDTKIDWTARDEKMVNTIRTLIALHHTLPALAADAPVEFIETDNAGVLAYKRGPVVVALNVANEDVTVALKGFDEGKYSLCLNSMTIEDGPVTVANALKAEAFPMEKKGYVVFVKE